jgi:cysteine sulfinate desulfinase/cysteine desulfurase-like protein
VLRALGVPERLAESTLRISLGRGTSAADVEAAADAIERELARLRGAAP